MRSARQLGDSSQPTGTAADDGSYHQPNTIPVGMLTGAPAPTYLAAVQVAPATGGVPTKVVTKTRENRFAKLIAPIAPFAIYIGDSGVNVNSGLALPPGIPFEITLPGNQELYAVTDAPVSMVLRVQVAAAISGNVERRP